MSQAWMIASGKGGVGKSSITAALSVALASRQFPTVAVDGDIGLRNLDLLLGMENKVVYDVVDVANKDCKLRYALIQDPLHPALSLLPAAQMSTPADLTPENWEQVIGKLRKRFSYVLLDAPAGLGQGVTNLIPSVDHTLLITTSDDIAIRDAERLITLLEMMKKPRPMLIVNRVRPELVKSGDMYSPQGVANLLDVPLLGFLPEDVSIFRAVRRHETLMETDGPARQAMDRICRRFLGESVPMPDLEKKRRFFGLSM